ncbi:MAG TPA: hypothetical protein VMW36_09775 [Patescibacteria group bacterium]|nr:hypothetical protein [Patescibacteria group bacterium]
MANFGDFKLNIPQLWEKDWDEAISDAEGISKEILKVQFGAARLLKGIDDFTLTPERLAWTTLWTRLFSSLEAALLAVNKNSEYTLRIISRAVFEDSLHGQMLLEHDQDDWDVNDKLCAYVAWCLWNDRQVFTEVLDNLDKIWSSSPTNDIALNPKMRNAFESVFGKLNLQSEHKLAWEKQKQKERAEETLERIKSWMEHPKLQPWLKRIKYLKKNRIRPSFYSLLDENTNNVRKRAEDSDIDFGYVLFKESSNLIHGSTIEQLLVHSDSSITPRFTGFSQETASSADYICGTCRSLTVLLYLIQKELWQVST